tara:strand:+ start:7771 stop:8325 length:555 start_codon:yes stop_codon:yes gene_type:complete
MISADKTISPVDVDARSAADIRAGDTVRVWQKIKEGEKTRLQAFEGLVIARKHGKEPGATFIVRKVASGVGVEKIFPLYSPNIDKVEVVKRSKVRRAKLYYIREKAAKEIKKKIRQIRFEAQDAISNVVPQEEKEKGEEEEDIENKKEENTTEAPNESKEDEKTNDEQVEEKPEDTVEKKNETD